MSKYLTYEEACDLLGVARSTMDRWRAANQGPRFTKLPNAQLRIREDDLVAWMSAQVAA